MVTKRTIEVTQSMGILDSFGRPYGVDHVGNKMRVSSMPLVHDIALGRASDRYALQQDGVNADIDQAEEVIWSVGGNYTYLTGGERLKISSSAISDRPAGSGARTIRVYGLNEHRKEKSEIITMDGQGTISTVNTYLRVYRAEVLTAGANGVNDGIIYIRNNANAVVLAQIEAGRGQSEMAMFSVPSGATFMLTGFWASESNGVQAKVRLYVRGYKGAWQKKLEIGVKQFGVVRSFQVPFKIEGMYDIELRGIGVGANNANISAGIEGWYEYADDALTTTTTSSSSTTSSTASTSSTSSTTSTSSSTSSTVSTSSSTTTTAPSGGQEPE